MTTTQADKIQTSIRPLNYERLPEALVGYYDRLSAYQAPFLQEKLAFSGEMNDPLAYSQAFTELKKFTALIKLYNKPVAMPSKAIDDVWHQFILFTREYHAYCEEFLGRYMHHEPNIPSRVAHGSASLDNLVTLYTRTFGDMPQVWGISRDISRKVQA